ncbi:MAG: LysR family transcriptional regulator, partial [Gammaproteobacteria bacterium]|nr:LysR family transcriptional regulator [Gammaproteobacteria bacterium]
MDFQNIQAFVSVAKHHSFSDAATELFLTQPAISKRVSQLEDEL